GFSIFNWIRFKKVKKEYAGVFTTNQVKRYVNWGMWPVLMAVGVIALIASFFMSDFSVMYGFISALAFVLVGLFARWRGKSIYGKALSNCPEELKPGLKKAMLCVSWVCQWRLVFAVFGAAAEIAAFNAVMQYGGTITTVTTTRIVSADEETTKNSIK
ncbi:MAG: hypothetical protein LBT12_05275, partial [Oscillospiraceae bacterium]|nr:hypothetical protein [Oscillospiraceae bacterium]